MVILLVAFPERPDLIEFLAKDTGNDYYLLNYSDKKYENQDLKFLKQIINLAEIDNFSAWVKKLHPDRVLFFEVSDVRLLFINDILSILGYQRIYLDHGVRDAKPYKYVVSIEKNQEMQRSDYNVVSPTSSTRSLFLEFFLLNSVWKKLVIIFYYLKYIIKKDKEKLITNLLAMGNHFSKYIIYCRHNLEGISLSVGREPSNVQYTGFPYSDHYFYLDKKEDSDYIVFIDHPYLETGICTLDEHRMMATTIQYLADKTGKKVVVKLHPKTLLSNWSGYNFKPNVELVTSFLQPQVYLDASMIMAFPSTLTINFLSKKKNIVLLGWFVDMEHFGNKFSDYGVCHFSKAPSDIYTELDVWMSTNLAEENAFGWDEFIHEYNDPFDGHATDRVIAGIVS